MSLNFFLFFFWNMHKQCHKEDPAQELLHALKGNSLQVFSVPSSVPEALMLLFSLFFFGGCFKELFENLHGDNLH